MAYYVDGFVLPVPKKNINAYRRMAQKAGKVWRAHGALEFRECVGDDLNVKMGLPFPRGIKIKPGETVVFSWIVYKSCDHRDRVNAKVMKDPRIAQMPKTMPHRDVSFVVISRAPLPKLEDYKKRMGWRFKWLSSHGTDFNFDYHVSTTEEEQAKGKMYYNYKMQDWVDEEMPGLSVFYKDKNGDVFHTYSTYARGLDNLVGTYNFLDLVPEGRDEDQLDFTMEWVRRHDQY